MWLKEGALGTREKDAQTQTRQRETNTHTQARALSPLSSFMRLFLSQAHAHTLCSSPFPSHLQRHLGAELMRLSNEVSTLERDAHRRLGSVRQPSLLLSLALLPTQACAHTYTYMHTCTPLVVGNTHASAWRSFVAHPVALPFAATAGRSLRLLSSSHHRWQTGDSCGGLISLLLKSQSALHSNASTKVFFWLLLFFFFSCRIRWIVCLCVCVCVFVCANSGDIPVVVALVAVLVLAERTDEEMEAASLLPLLSLQSATIGDDKRQRCVCVCVCV